MTKDQDHPYKGSMTTQEALKHLAASPAIGWQCDEWDRLAMTTLMASVKTAEDLLERAATLMEDRLITSDVNWWREYFIFTGEHMILTDEGWVEGRDKPLYAAQAAEDEIPMSDLVLDEVNVPA